MPRRVASHIESPGLVENLRTFCDSDKGNRRPCYFEGVVGLVLNRFVLFEEIAQSLSGLEVTMLALSGDYSSMSSSSPA